MLGALTEYLHILLKQHGLVVLSFFLKSSLQSKATTFERLETDVA